MQQCSRVWRSQKMGAGPKKRIRAARSFGLSQPALRASRSMIIRPAA
jgi:hypothetical protein